MHEYYLDVNKLRGKIIERGFTVLSLAEAISVNRSTLYRAFKTGGLGLTIGTVEKLAAVLNLSSDEILEIFFAAKVA